MEAIASSVSDQSGLFGVVPTLFVLSPLALLVPATLGGLALCLRRWLALLSVASLGSTLHVLHGLFRGYIKDFWWGSPRALFGALAVVALTGVVWSWRRHQGARPVINAALTSEGIVLWALAFTCAGLAAIPQSNRPPQAVTVLWAFEPPERGGIISSPLVAGERVYVAAIHDSAFSSAGAVYCLERDTGRVVWKFTDGGRMLHGYSTPCLSDGRLYIGEGMHANFVCKLYCLNAESGRKLWDFTASNHIESSPCVVDGKVFFGAGDDGVYCLDAVTGNKLWQFQGACHVDTSPAVVGRSLYAGSGVSRTYDAPKIFCLDTEDGTVRWQVPTELPVWGSPAVDGGQVFFGLGNGRLLQGAQPPEQPAGALLCVEAATGRRLWDYAVADAVFVQPAVDQARVYFGARDGHCYCLDRRGGRLCWKTDLGSAVMSRPALARGRVYTVASGGCVCRLNADSGVIDWTFDVAAYSKTTPRLLSSPVVVDAGEGLSARRLYFGAELQNPISSAAVLYCLQD